MMAKSSTLRKTALAALLLAALFAFAMALRMRSVESSRVTSSVGELQVVHAELRIGKRELRGTLRFAVGDVIESGPDGRARIRLDDGTRVIMDRATRMKVGASGLSLEAGRIFVQAGDAARSQVALGDVSTVVAASTLAFERRPAESHVYCANGEVVLRAGGQQQRLRSGESAHIRGANIEVVPEKAWNDWTGGMAGVRPRAAIGELWSRSSERQDDVGSPLTIRSHEVTAKLEGEQAHTRLESTYFNAGGAAADGDFRLSVPRSAVISRFALRRGTEVAESDLFTGIVAGSSSVARLEWAGEGWVRGYVPAIAPGSAVTVIVEYVEWLSANDGHVTYRYPMQSEGNAPLIGELRVRLDARALKPRAISAAAGASVREQMVELRKADVRPESDFVVELELPDAAAKDARVYVAEAEDDEADPDRYVLVRAPLPAANAESSALALALVLDSSWSAAPGALDAGRAFVEALLEGLGPRDCAAVLAADQTARAIGPAGCQPVDEARRSAVRAALADLRPAGATDLGVAFEQAADALPADADQALVVYIGDGWPTVGDMTAPGVRARLSRRKSGAPRLSAIALGTRANREGLRALVRNSGPVLEVVDRADAAEAAVDLLASALQPVVDGVEFDLGPDIDRVYPRGPQTVAAGMPASVVGRLRGKLPGSVVLRYRRKGRVVEETRALQNPEVARPGDVRARWASARVDDLVQRGEAIEIAADLAQRSRLLTPWTGWYVSTSAGAFSTPIGDRMLELSAVPAALRGDGFALANRTGTLLEAPPAAASSDSEPDFRNLIAQSARRTLDAALPGVQRCRNARAVLRPELSGVLQVQLTVDGAGRATHVNVRAQNALDDDRALDHCVASLIEALEFFDSGTPGAVQVEHLLTLPAPRDIRARQCSASSSLPLPLRRGVWRERLRTLDPLAVFQRARRSCELRSWADQRVLLDVAIADLRVASALALASALAQQGETDAAAYLRRSLIERCRTPHELLEVRAAVIGGEPRAGREFERQYRAATGAEGRLAVVRRFLRLSPHDPTLRRALLALLEGLGRKELLEHEIRELRSDPFADAGVLADAAVALLRLGRKDDARRTFGELIERAPADAYARAYAGDRLRDEQLFDDAAAAYSALDELVPSDPSTALRLALAHAGAQRLDVATRLLARVAQGDGRVADTGLSELASMVSAVQLRAAREQAAGAEAQRLDRRALELPLPDVSAFVLIQAPLLEGALAPRLRRGASGVESNPDLAAPSLGLYALRLERGDGDVRVLLRRPSSLPPTRDASISVDVVSIDEDRHIGSWTRKRLTLAADGKDQELRWSDGALM